jgi:hypothetical protein
MKKLTLKGLAERWSKTEDEILNIAADGKLIVSLHLYGYLVEGEQRLDKLKDYGTAPYDTPVNAVQQGVQEIVDTWRTADYSQEIKFKPHDGLVQMRVEDVFLFVGQKDSTQLTYVRFEEQPCTMLNREYVTPSFKNKDLIFSEDDVLEYEENNPPDLRNPPLWLPRTSDPDPGRCLRCSRSAISSRRYIGWMVMSSYVLLTRSFSKDAPLRSASAASCHWS